jgi:archaellum component FlaC
MDIDKVKNDILEIETADDLALAQDNLTSVENDIVVYKKSLDAEVKGLENYREQVELAESIRKIIEASPNKVPEHFIYEFEKNPEYWELRAKELYFKFRQERHMDEAKIKEFERRIEAVTEQIESHTKKAELLRSLIEQYEGGKNE